MVWGHNADDEVVIGSSLLMLDMRRAPEIYIEFLTKDF